MFDFSSSDTGEGRSFGAFSDRLFLVYYPLPPGFNGNKWGVTESSINKNINSAIGKPVVVYRKNPNNPLHAHQAGNFIHPTPEEAAVELGRPPKAEDYYQWQEKFAIGRIHNVEQRGTKGYAFTLEITDPDFKQTLKSNENANGLPGWTSPQILSNPGLYPDEERTSLFDHWSIAHVALVDSPAYGTEQSAIRAKCFGAEKDCMISTRSASQENLGFCIKQAAQDLVQSRIKKETADTLRTLSANLNSSQSSALDSSSHSIMSQQSTGNDPIGQPGNVVYRTETGTNINPNQPGVQTTITAETKEEIDKKQGEHEKDQPAGQEEKEPLNQGQGPQSLQEAQTMITKLTERVDELQKTLKTQNKEFEQIKLERKAARLSFIIPRDLFKTDKSHQDAVAAAMDEPVSEAFLIEHWKTKRELAQLQGMIPKSAMTLEQPIAAKSASHEVPNYDNSSSSNKTSGPSIVQRQLELQRMIIGGESY
jgi:hypothetical protein